MAFSNVGMKHVVAGKPHIQFIEGYWRVSPYRGISTRWNKAHRFASKLNTKLLEENFCAWLSAAPPGRYTFDDPVECEYVNRQSVESAYRTMQRKKPSRLVYNIECKRRLI